MTAAREVSRHQPYSTRDGSRCSYCVRRWPCPDALPVSARRNVAALRPGDLVRLDRLSGWREVEAVQVKYHVRIDGQLYYLDADQMLDVLTALGDSRATPPVETPSQPLANGEQTP